MTDMNIHGGSRENPADETLGSYLKSLRESRGISVEEVADRTKIAISQIAAIENDQHQFLPPKAFVLGFIKSICNELRGDYEHARRLLSSMLGEVEVKSERVILENPHDDKIETAKEILSKNSSLSPFLFGVAIVVVAIAITYFYLGSQPDEPLANERSQYDAVAEAQRSLQEQQAAEEEARRQEELQRQQAAEEERQRLEAEERRLALQAERESRQQAAVAQQLAQQTPEPIQNPFAGAFLNEIPLAVRLEGLSEAWVKMVGSHGAAMETTTLREGGSLTIESVGTVIVALGNAGGVNVFVDDKEHGQVGRLGQVRRFLVEPRDDDQYRIIQISRDQYIAILRSLGQTP